MRIELQSWNGPVVVAQEDGIVTAAGGTPKTLIDYATELVGTSPADTDAAIDDLIGGGYKIRLGAEGKLLY